jgi:hypothetical protein
LAFFGFSRLGHYFIFSCFSVFAAFLDLFHLHFSAAVPVFILFMLYVLSQFLDFVDDLTTFWSPESTESSIQGKAAVVYNFAY